MAEFVTRVRELAATARLDIIALDYRHAHLKIETNDGSARSIWIVPYDNTWEFSCQSSIQMNHPESFPQWLLVTLMIKNSRNKRAFWCIELLEGKHTLSAMYNYPELALMESEFGTICRALLHEVETLEQEFLHVVR